MVYIRDNKAEKNTRNSSPVVPSDCNWSRPMRIDGHFINQILAQPNDFDKYSLPII